MWKASAMRFIVRREFARRSISRAIAVSPQFHQQSRFLHSITAERYHTVLNTDLQKRSNFFFGTKKNFATNAIPGMTEDTYVHPLDPLTATEISITSSTVKKYLASVKDCDPSLIRFISVSLCEPKKNDLLS